MLRASECGGFGGDEEVRNIFGDEGTLAWRGGVTYTGPGGGAHRL